MPHRSGLRLAITHFGYRHLRGWGRARIASAIVLTGLGVVTLVRGGRDRKTYGWAAWFLGGTATEDTTSYPSCSARVSVTALASNSASAA